MTWRTVVITKRAKLDLRLNHLIVRGENIRKIHLGEISNLIIESTEVSMTAALLAELVSQKVKVIFCDTKRNPTAEIVGYYGSHDTSSKIKQQITWDHIAKSSVWTEIVHAKIKNQLNFLQQLELSEAVTLHRYLCSLENNDSTNREALAAKVYFAALFGNDFTRADDTFLNAALNYGYSILLSAVNREIVANGYITQIGVFHDNVFNQFNLGSDLMESFRPFFDRTVYFMWKKGQLKKFEHEEKMAILATINQECVQDFKVQIINNAIKVYCKSVLDALSQADASLIKNISFYDGGV